MIVLGAAQHDGASYTYALGRTEGAARYLPEGWTVYRRRDDNGAEWGAVSSFAVRDKGDALRYAAGMLLGDSTFAPDERAPYPFNRTEQTQLFSLGDVPGEQTSLF